MDKRTINIIIGVVLALFAIFMIQRHMVQREALIHRLIAEGQLVEVVMARTDIPKETTITMDMVGTKRVKANIIQRGDLTSLDSAIGKFAEVDILRGQHINSDMVRALGGARFLSQAVPQGMRAMTISVDKISAIEGLIKPGDNVDVVATFDVPDPVTNQSETVVVTIFQGVGILATNKNLSQYRTADVIDTVTMSLRPDDIKILTYILQYSTIRLVLRAPLDEATEYGYRAVTWEALMRRLGMWQEMPVEPPQPTIEIYRATSMEESPTR